MKRRSFLIMTTALPFARMAAAAGTDYQVDLVYGGHGQLMGRDSEDVLLAGLRIKLAPHWKTYWRNPGDAGIPPQIEVHGKSVSTVALSMPLPKRIREESGETFGYVDEVVFPIEINTRKNDPLDVNVSAFLGICGEVCKPVKFEAALDVSKPQPELMAQWIARVPKEAAFFDKVTLVGDELHIALRQAVDDIFVEVTNMKQDSHEIGKSRNDLYFGKPDFVGNMAVIKIKGLDKSPFDAQDVLVLTADAKGKGLVYHVGAKEISK